MLKYILYNDYFITLISILLTFNIILTNSTEIKISDKTIVRKKQMNKIESFKDKTIDFFILIFCIIFIYIFLKQKSLFSFFIIITVILSFVRIFKNYIKDSLNLNYESKLHYISATCFLQYYFHLKHVTYIFLHLISFHIFSKRYYY